MFLKSGILIQAVKLQDGRELELFFDFSKTQTPFTENVLLEKRPTIHVNANAIRLELRLDGRHKGFVINSEMFGILLVAAYSRGWRGGPHLLKSANGQVTLRNIEKATLDDSEARSLGDVLSQMMKVDAESLAGGDLQPVFDLLDLCKSGGFTISISSNN